MKTRHLLFAALLAAPWASSAPAQGVDPESYQAWVRRQRSMAQERRLNDATYRSYYNLNGPRYYRPSVPDPVSRSKSYYRGPGGEVVDSTRLPKDALSRGYRYKGSYGPANPAPATGAGRKR